MSRSTIVWSAALLTAGTAMLLSQHAVRAQGGAAAKTQPERQLVSIRLGRNVLDLVRRFGRPSEVQTVALAAASDQLPGVGGGGGAAGAMGMGGMMGGAGGSGGGAFGAPGAEPGGGPFG